MKKSLKFGAALTAALALALTACANDNATSSDNTSKPATTSTSTKPASSAAQGGGDASNYVPTCPGGDLSSSGSTAQANALEIVIADYQKACSGSKVNYGGGGSGKGVKDVIAKTTDWAGSDSVLNGSKNEPADFEKAWGGPAIHLPLAAGPIAIVYNVDGVDNLVLKSATIAKIFKGDIKNWNDPAIAADNSGATLPDAPIQVFYRQEESGTTDNFTNFLNKAAGDVWTDAHSKSWKGAGKGVKGSAGISQSVKTTANSISYDEWSYATDNGLKMAAIDNGAGPVKLTGESAGKAIAAAKPSADAKGANDLQLELQYQGLAADVYPAVLVTYEIIPSTGLDAKKSAMIKDFMKFFASKKEQDAIVAKGYASLPAEVQAKIYAAVDSIK